MDRVNLPFFYELGWALRQYAQFPVVNHTNRVDCVIASLSVRPPVRMLLDSYPALTVCRSLGEQLIFDIDALFASFRDATPEQRDAEDPTIDFRYNNSIGKAREFQTVLTAELTTFGAYQVSQKGIYSTSDLIDNAQEVFGAEIKATLAAQANQALDDTNQAGRCLALDLPTASGFHIMRALETVLKQYRDEFGAATKGRSWGAYIKALKSTKASPKVVATLDQIRDLHRNPTIHTDIVLSPDEATDLFSIAQSAISAMVRDINEHTVAQTTPASQSATGSNEP